jgi:hypothetical protein
MTATFAQLLSDCLVALGDPSGLTWARTTVIWPWCIEAMRTFPLLRPQREDHTILAGEEWHYDLPANFREVISVEYPVGQSPPKFLIMKNRLDPEFYSTDEFFDVDHNYADGIGWIIHFSAAHKAATHVYVEYLAEHDLDMADDQQHFITVADEFYSILLAQVCLRAYRERLGAAIQDPTAHTNIIYQLTEMVRKAEQNYNDLLAATWQKISNSKVSPRQAVDRFDRVY